MPRTNDRTSSSGSKTWTDDLDSVKSDLSDLRSDLRSLADSLFDQGKASASSAKQRVTEDVHEKTESVRERITEQPFVSVAIAGVVGLILGLVLRGR